MARTGEDLTEWLAYHSCKAELWPKAPEYALTAGDKAIDRSAYREPSRFLKDAINAIDAQPQTPETIWRAIDVRLRLRVADTGSEGGLVQLGNDLAKAELLARSINDPTRLRNIAIHQG